MKVTVEGLPSSNHSVADVLRQHAVDVAAEPMVIGALFIPPLCERSFGGVMKSMLDAQLLAVLMAR